MDFFKFGFRQMFPVMTGVIPFGFVVGTAAHEAGLSVGQSAWMNVLVFAGASQLAALDLLTQKVPLLVIVATGLIINLRFLLYSAAFSPFARGASWGQKLLCAYMLTDQSYTVMSANEQHFRSNQDALKFYFGSCACMTIAWHVSVLIGFFFGNVSPLEWSLDFAVPLSFVVLVIPTLRTWKHRFVAVSSGFCGLLFRNLPFNVGLLVASICAMGIATFLMGWSDSTKPGESSK
jgi:predicted branched-subunit amino acid permease